MEIEPLRVTDPATLRAFAHPLRLRILSEVAQMGRSNVVRVAERLGEPANSVSYHLSILARHGLVVPAEPPPDATRRERWWQSASTTGFAVDTVDEETRPALTEALVAWSQQRVGEVVRRLLAAEAEAEARGLPCQQIGLGVWLAPEEAREVATELQAVARRLSRRSVEQREAGTLTDGPGAGADFYVFDATFFADLSGQAPLRGSLNVDAGPEAASGL